MDINKTILNNVQQQQEASKNKLNDKDFINNNDYNINSDKKIKNNEIKENNDINKEFFSYEKNTNSDFDLLLSNNSNIIKKLNYSNNKEPSD